MKLYITGATGFVGSSVVAAATANGHDVIAVVRPGSSATVTPTESADPDVATGSVTEARVDLRSRKGLAESLAGADAVIHLAAAKEGDFYTQFAGTVVATENLLAAMVEAEVTNLVAISTFSVYEYLKTKPGTLITEDSPLDATPALRDEYAQTKLIQEELYRDFGSSTTNRCVIIRPGMIYGRDNLWHALLGAELGPLFLRVGKNGTLPLTYVENCADAMVLAAERLIEPASSVDGEIINIVDDNLPTQQDYADLVSTVIEPPTSVPVPWPVLRTAAGLVKRANQTLLGGRAKFPGIAVPDRLHARFKPLRYTNSKAKELLGWQPRYSLDEAVSRSVS